MRLAIAAALVTVSVTNGTSALIACGDKFLVPARSTRYSTPPPKREPASLLLHAPPTSAMSRMMTRLALAKTLQKAGYLVTETVTEPQLANALSQGRWDLVLVDLSDVRLVAGRSGDPAVPALMPVSYTLTGSQWADARQRYPLIVRSPKKAQSWLEAIDAALEAQRRTGARERSR